MIDPPSVTLDLTPPPFADGLCDWSRGDGTPDFPTYERDETARIVRYDPDFGDCLELSKIEPVQRLRYMGEMPLRVGSRIEIRVRAKAVRGPLAAIGIAAWPGGVGGAGVPSLPTRAPEVRLVAHEAVTEIRAVIGCGASRGVDLVWDERAIFAHVGIDLTGPSGGATRIENFAVREILSTVRSLPGFEAGEP